jgi:hypothetical protein
MSQPNATNNGGSGNGSISTTNTSSPSVQLIPPPPPPPPPPHRIPTRNTTPSHPLEYASKNVTANTNKSAASGPHAGPTIAPMTKASASTSTSTSTPHQTQIKKQTQSPKPDSAEMEVDKFLSAH